MYYFQSYYTNNKICYVRRQGEDERRSDLQSLPPDRLADRNLGV